MYAPDPAPRITAKAVVSGFLLAIVLCAINSYLTLSFGVIEEGPTIAALFFFAFVSLARLGVTKTELVIVATMGSAGGSLGFIANFYAAKAMLGQPYSVFEMTAFATVTSLLGMLFVIPLRDLLVIKEELPWPGAKATASVISSLVSKTDGRQAYYLLLACAIVIVFVVGNTEDGFGWFPAELPWPWFGLAAFGAGLSLSPFATAGSYLMGLNVCLGFGVGGVVLLGLGPYLGANAATPHRYVWPGIGFLLGSGLTVMLLNWRITVESIASLGRLRASGQDDDAIMSARHFLALASLTLVIVGLFAWIALDLNVVVIVALIVLAGFIQNVIATRAAAQTAFNPARVMGVLLQGACALLGATSASANLAGAGFVAGSGAQAGMLTNDMAYGRWLGVPARWQFWAQMLTVIPTAWVSAIVFQWIHSTKTISLEGGLVAPVAKIWATAALIFEGQRPMPPFAIEAMLIAAGIAVVYTLLEERAPFGKWLPSATGIGLGLVLAPSMDFAFLVGGVVMWLVLPKVFKVSSATLTTIGVAAIVGEGLAGVIKALLADAGIIKL